MEVNNKRKIILTIIGVATLLILVISATFAYFSASTSNDKGTTNVTASTEKVGSIALSNPTGDLHLNLSVSDMAQDNLNTYWATDNESKNYDSEEVPREIAVAELSGGSATAKYECTTTISVELSDTMASKLQPGDGYIQFGELLTDKIDLTSISADGYLVTFKLDGTNVKRQRVTAAIALDNRNADQSYIAGEKLGITFSNSDLECQVVGSSKYKGSKLSEAIIAMSEEAGSGIYHETASGSYNAIIPANEEAWSSVNTTKDMYCWGECSEGLLSQLNGSSIFTPTGESGVWNFTTNYYLDEDDLEGITYGDLTLVPKESGYYTVKFSHSFDFGIVITINNEVIFDDSDYKDEGYVELGYLTSSDEINILAGYPEASAAADSGYFIFYREETTDVDAGYRYEGSEVNNYVTFNDETWRIIGVEEGSAIGLTESEWYTKIIRNNSLGVAYYYTELLIYDEGIYGNFVTDILNDNYYNKSNYSITSVDNYFGEELTIEYDYSETGLNTDAKSLMVKSNWYEITYDEVSTSSKTYIKEKYEGNSNSRYVGLMSPSDYGYGAVQSECANVSLPAYSSGCASKNWLFNNESEWLLSDVVYNSEDDLNFTLIINITGNGSSYSSSDPNAYRPVVYLNSDVIITGGNGTIDSKYEISLES